MRKIIRVVLLSLLLMGLCTASAIRVVTTDFICFDFARAVCGEDAEITMLLRPGMEVHTYDPTPTDILKIADCDLFICIGGESDEWVDDILESFGDKVPRILRLMDSVDALYEEKTEEMTDHSREEEPEYDEHIWTSPKNAIRMLEAIEDAANEFGDYSAAAYIREVEEIDRKFQKIVETADRDLMIFADRFPFLYFVREYGLQYMAAFPSCSAESEPSARTVAALIDAVREEEIPCVYVLEMSGGQIARTISEETGAKRLTFYSMQTISPEDMINGETYISLMKRNIKALEEGLLS